MAVILNRLPMENKCLVKRLLWLLGEFHEQTRTPVESQLLVSCFSQLLFNVVQPDYGQILHSAGLAGATTEGSQNKRDKVFGITSIDNPFASVNKRELIVSTLVYSLMESATSISNRLVECIIPQLLEDEEIIHRVYRTQIESVCEDAIVFLTTYRLIIQTPTQEEISVPIMTIRHAEMISASKKKRSRTVSLITKDYRSFQLEFEAPLYAIMFWDIIANALSPKNPLRTFAFKWKPHYPLPASQGWAIYDAVDEFERQGLLKIEVGATNSSHLRYSKLNASYDVPSYPSGWIVPISIEDTELRRLLPSRMRQRLPIVTWGRPGGGGMLLRADEPDLANFSDPKDAKAVNRVAADLRLMDALSSGCSGKVIIDLGASRTYRYAYSGTDWKITFLDTMNNKSLADQYATFLYEAETSDKRATSNRQVGNIFGMSQMGVKGGLAGGVQQLALEDPSIDSQWSAILQKVISTASSITDLLANHNECVLLTHSSGSDLDFVVSSLVQIMMDGYYRTINGLAVLLEKDWSSFGYDWSRKLGHSTIFYLDEGEALAANAVSSSGNVITPTTPEQSPCIDLFIEAIWQMTLQFPMHFEYTESCLVYLLDSIYSGRFGTFLLNSEKERESFAKDKTTSFWAHLNHHIQQHQDDSEFVNFFYDPDTVFAVLDPRYELSTLKLWYSKHLSQRQHAEMMSINSLVESACNASTSNVPQPMKTVSPSNSIPNVNISSPRRKPEQQQQQQQQQLQTHLLVTTTSSSRGSKETPPANQSSSSGEMFQSVDGSASESASVASEATSLSQSTSRSELFGSSEMIMVPDIVELDLSRRALKTIPLSVCVERNAAKLQSLNFSYNRLNFFPSDILRLTRLRRLNLSNNPIGDISRDHFFMMGSRMNQLQHLDLSNTNLAYLPDDLSTMRFLRILIIKENHLEELPPNISSLVRLEVLDARKNRLRSIPKTLFKLHSLRVLSLGDNSIAMADETSFVPSAAVAQQDKKSARHASDTRAKSLSSAAAVSWSFRNLIQLEVLDWRGNSKNAKNEIPSAIFSLPAAQSLHIEDNSLTSLSSEIGKMITLTYLNISYNQLSSLPNEVTQLTNLRSLNARHNRLNSLPPNLSVLPLHSLDLNSNRFRDVPLSVLNMPQLTTLNMSNNSIRKVPTALVENLVRLNSLYLSDNQITTLDNLPGLGNLTRMRVLALNGNQFERLPVELWKLEGILRELTLDTSISTRIVFPPRDILLKGTVLILRYLSERASMGESDSRINVVVIGDLPSHKNTLIRRMVRAPSKHKDTFTDKSSAAPMLSTGAIGMGSVISLSTGSQSVLNISSAVNASPPPTLEKYEWTITSSYSSSSSSSSNNSEKGPGGDGGSSKLVDSSVGGSQSHHGTNTGNNIGGGGATTLRQPNSEARAIVWEINLDSDRTRSFLHPNFLNDRSFYIVTWEISPLTESLHTWLEIVTSRSKKAQFIVVGLQVGDTAVQKDYLTSMDHELSKRYTSAYRGFLAAPANAKSDIKTLQARIEEAILDCPLPRESHPASYFTLERFLLSATDVKPPLMSYAYFESVAKSCGAKDMKKLLRHLMSLGLLLYISDSPILDKFLLLDPLWPFNFITHLASTSKVNVKSSGLVSHEGWEAAAKAAEKTYPEICFPTLCALQHAIGLVFPLVIPTPQLQLNLGLSNLEDSNPCVAVEAYTQPKIEEMIPEFSFSSDATTASHLRALFANNSTRAQAPYMAPKVFPTLHSWIPTLCEESKTSVLTKFWPRYLPTNGTLRTLQCGRKYVFASNPYMLFNRLLARILSLVKVECLYRSACLVVNATNPSGENLAALGPAELIHISLNRPSKTIKVMVRTSLGVSILTDVYETLDSLMRDMKITPVTVTLPCPHCLDERLPKAYHFQLEEVEKASVVTDSVLYCQEYRPIASKYVAPDMALCNIALGRHVPMSEIDLIKLIGEGAAAEVFLGDLDGELVAVKRLRVLKQRNTNGSAAQDIMVGNDTTASKALAEFRREIRFLGKFKHAAIVGLKGIVLDPPCIITEYCEGGNLFEYCHPPRDRVSARSNPGETSRAPSIDPTSIAASYPVNWSIRLKVALDIAEGMSLLHAHMPAIIHRDLKSPNILLQLSSTRHRLNPDKSASNVIKSVNRSPSTPIVSHAEKKTEMVSSLAMSSASVPALDHGGGGGGGAYVSLKSQTAEIPKQSHSSSSSPKSDQAGRKEIHHPAGAGTSHPSSSPAMVATSSSTLISKPSRLKNMPSNLEDRLNMWTAQDAIAKITDFGLTGVAPAVAGREVDNPVWLAPEVMLRGVEYAEQTDVYSYAVILYELLTNREYFGHLSFMTDIERAVLSGQRPVLPSPPTANAHNAAYSSMNGGSNFGNSKPNKLQLANSAAASTSAIQKNSSKLTDSASISAQSAPQLKISSSFASKASSSAVAAEKDSLVSYPEDLWKVPEFVHLMYHCLSSNPCDRPTFFEIVETLKYIIMMHPEYASNISFPPGSDISIHSNSDGASVNVLPSESTLTVDLCPESVNIEYMGVGEPVSALHFSDNHVWMGFGTGTMICYHVPPHRGAPPSSNGSDDIASQASNPTTTVVSRINMLSTASSSMSMDGSTSERQRSSSASERTPDLIPMLVGTYRSHKANVVSIGTYNGTVCSMSTDKIVTLWTLPKLESRDKPRVPSITNLDPLDDVPSSFTSNPVGIQTIVTGASSSSITNASMSASSVAAAFAAAAAAASSGGSGSGGGGGGVGSIPSGMNEQLVVTLKSGGLRCYDSSVSKWKERKVGSSSSSSQVNCIVRIPKFGHYWVGCDRKIIRLDENLKQIDSITVVSDFHQITCLIKAGNHVWSGCGDGIIRIYDEQTGALFKTMAAHSDEVNCMIQVGPQVWTAGKDRNIIIWNILSFQMVKEIKKAHNDNITSLCLVQNKEVWSGSADKQIGRWVISSCATSALARSDDEMCSPRDSSSPGSIPINHHENSEQAPNSSELSDTTSNSSMHPSPTISKRKKKRHHPESVSETHDASDSITRVTSTSSISSVPSTQTPNTSPQPHGPKP
jgi:Leucine-rich repeat (LRR) protein